MNSAKIYIKSAFFLILLTLAGCDNQNEDIKIASDTITPNKTNNVEVNDTTVNSKDTTSGNKIPLDNSKLDVTNVKFGPASEMFREGMNDIFDAYMSITYSLCFNDPKGVKSGTTVFKDMHSRIDPSLISGEMRNYWDKYSAQLNAQVLKIEAANDIETQRVAYADLSDLMTVAIKNYRIKGKVVKKYSCPKALGGKGAYWYFEDSPSYTLMNPYLGQESKDCLEPVETIEYKK